jgi:hypothetical protein
MIVAACPSCREDVTVPIDARPTSIVRCPLCNAECRLEQFLAQLPPPLIVLADANAADDNATPAPVEPTEESVPRPADSGEDVAIDIGRSLEVDEQLPAFDFQPAAEAPPGAPRELARRPTRGAKNPVWEIVKIVGGALLAVPAAQIILWWCVPYNWKRDLLGVGPSISRVAPWIVPAKFHAEADDLPSTSDSTTTEDSDAVTPQHRRANTARPWRSNLPQPGAGVSEPGVPGDNSPTVVDRSRDAPPDQGNAAVEPATPAPAAGNTSVEPDGTQPQEPAPPSPPPARDEATGPGAPGAPLFDAADLRAALERALQASVAWDMSSNQTAEHRAQLTNDFYSAFANLGETMAFMTPGDAGARDLAAQIHQLLASLEQQPKKLAMIGNRTAEWLDQSARPNQGVVLFGTVTSVHPAGALFATELDLASLERRSVTVVSRIEPQGFYAPGDHLLMLGALIRDPARSLPGYEGGATEVVLGSFPVRLR